MKKPGIRSVLFVLLVLALPAAGLGATGETYRLYDGITLFVNNEAGRDFTLSLDVRDINLLEKGPRELLVKVYDPDGRTVIREVIPDDGVTSGGVLPFGGGWDHEAWYYANCYMKGLQPLARWSMFSAPDRLAATPKRTFSYAVKGGAKGVYRSLVVGVPDHYVTVRVDPELPHGVCSNPWFLHGSGDMLRKSFIYMPRGTKAIELAVAEYDLPRTRTFTLRAADGAVLWEGRADGGVAFQTVRPEKDVSWDDQIFTFEVGPGAGDFMVNFGIIAAKDRKVVQTRAQSVTMGVFAPDEATARAIQGGVIYRDGQVFWQMSQVRLYEWLKKLGPADFEVPAEYALTKESPKEPGFFPLNGVHTAPPACDRYMHDYPAHRNRQVLNAAIQDLASGLRGIGPNDHVAVATFRGMSNLGYENGNYAFHFWRPAWRILQQSDAPEDVKAIIREAVVNAMDRLAFCRTWERVNGNAFAQLVAALRYGAEATGDPLNRELFEVYWDRFCNGGWGERAGVGPSGPIQEGFGYDHHYGSYILSTWRAINADLKDPRLIAVYDRIQNLYSYTQSAEIDNCCPWDARTHHGPQWGIATNGAFRWKGLPGPDLTDSVNGGNEWFAARRTNYYFVAYYGRLSRKWEGEGFQGQIGYGGGIACQLTVPGRGIVLASTLNGSYGAGMHPTQWTNFHIHSVVGTMADGRPLVAADCEMFNARLATNTVSGSGEVRDSSVRVARSYTFRPDSIACEVRLAPTAYNDLLSMWMPNRMRGTVSEAYEMIPFAPRKVMDRRQRKDGEPTDVTVEDAAGRTGGALGAELMSARAVVIDRGGFGVRVEFDEPMPVKRGLHDTVLVRLASAPTNASAISLAYRLVPFSQ